MNLLMTGASVIGVGCLREHDDLMPSCGLGLGKGMDMPTETPVDDRRVLPGQVQNAHE